MERLEKRAVSEVLICDGAMGTELQQRGLEIGSCPELWCLEKPELVKEIHQAYKDAGSNIVETNTFCGSRYKLDKFGLSDKVEQINFAGVKIAREIAGHSQYVIASLGPTGEFMQPIGLETEQSFYETFCTQAKAFEAGGADAVIVETMTSIEECCVAIRAVLETTGLTCIASFTFDPLADGRYASMMGVFPEQFAEQAIAAGAHILGSNCGLGPAHMINIIRSIRAVAGDIPLMAMPNAGMPELKDDETIFPEGPEQFASHVEKLIEVGASIIGGCCGTTPAHIAALAEKIKSL
ncbi:MAG: homocysteine S-methyltransferase family protein [Kiritimatiellae bacterium]|jgi:5-methyltetrahydrofolate--homocysteine methyltransferase|nr:homocysteine S-methyltransferase family protein [Kiritimatiellia bacterium]